MRVVVATRNRGKLRELMPLLSGAGLGLELVTIDELAPDAELREDGDTFEANALAKARQAAQATGLPALADDSGLEVDALGGAPGVYSARYAGPGADDARNNAKLLEALRDVAPAGRGGRYRCVAAFVDPARGLELTRAGSCAGEILAAPARRRRLRVRSAVPGPRASAGRWLSCRWTRRTGCRTGPPRSARWPKRCARRSVSGSERDRRTASSRRRRPPRWRARFARAAGGGAFPRAGGGARGARAGATKPGGSTLPRRPRIWRGPSPELHHLRAEGACSIARLH